MGKSHVLHTDTAPTLPLHPLSLPAWCLQAFGFLPLMNGNYLGFLKQVRDLIRSEWVKAILAGVGRTDQKEKK